MGENRRSTRLGITEYSCWECKITREVKYTDDYKYTIDMEVADGERKQAEASRREEV